MVRHQSFVLSLGRVLLVATLVVWLLFAATANPTAGPFWGEPQGCGGPVCGLNATYFVVTGVRNEDAYIGGDGIGCCGDQFPDIQIGSLNPRIVWISLWNPEGGFFMNLVAHRGWFVGDLDVNGVKRFIQAHPTNSGKQIAYVSLEGPEAGTYAANLILRRSVTLVGEGQGRTILKGAEVDKPVLYIESERIAEVTLEDVTITGAKGDYKANGIQVYGQDGVLTKVTIRNVEISGNDHHGLYIFNYATLALIDSKISDNGGSGLATTDYSTQISVINTFVARNALSGIDMQWVGTNVKVEGSLIIINSQTSFNGYYGIGIDTREGHHSEIIDTLIKDNGDNGIFAEMGVVVIENAQISSNQGNGISASESWVLVNNSLITYSGRCGLHGSEYSRIGGWANRFSNNRQGDACGTDAKRLSRTLPAYPHSQQEVKVPEDVATIQQAIDLVADGGIVLIDPGVYQETLELIDVSLTIKGVNKEQVILNTDRRGPAVLVFSKAPKNASIESITFGPSLGVNLIIGGSAVLEIHFSIIEAGYVRVEHSARVTAEEIQISHSKHEGLVAVNSAQVSLFASQISGSERTGLSAYQRSQVILVDSVVSGNGSHGLLINDWATVEVRSSAIKGNGTDPDCQNPDRICNGITVDEWSQMMIIDSRIINNADWGVAAWLKKCGYSRDYFTKQVSFEGTNTIEGNNTSGNLDGMGNPGNHPWNRPDVPDGQVCLP